MEIFSFVENVIFFVYYCCSCAEDFNVQTFLKGRSTAKGEVSRKKSDLNIGYLCYGIRLSLKLLPKGCGRSLDETLVIYVGIIRNKHSTTNRYDTIRTVNTMGERHFCFEQQDFNNL